MEGLFKISFNITDMFNAQRNAQHARRYTRFLLFFLAQLLMSGSSRMDDQRFGIAYISEVVN